MLHDEQIQRYNDAHDALMKAGFRLDHQSGEWVAPGSDRAMVLAERLRHRRSPRPPLRRLRGGGGVILTREEVARRLDVQRPGNRDRVNTILGNPAQYGAILRRIGVVWVRPVVDGAPGHFEEAA